MVDKGPINVTTADLSVERGGFHSQLTLGEGNHCSGQTRVANIDEDHMLRVISFREVGFRDSVAESGSGSVVDETKDIQASNAGGVNDSPSLDIGVPDGDGQNDVGDADFELVRSDVPKFPQVSTDELGGGESLGLAEVFNLNADGSVDIDQSRVHEGLFDILDVGVRDSSTDQSFEAANRVTEVGGLLGFGRFTNRSLFGTERDE